MNTMKICPGCQKPLEANAPDGLCPECLLKAGLGTGVDLGPDSQAESGRTSFVAPPLEEVARLFPQVEILGFIGQGGMGAVYKARQKSLDRVVALKILPPGIGKDAAFAERFTREAKALARLNHPGVVTIYEFGQADGLFFFLMEFVDGMSLRHLLEVERISAREALAIVPQICDALQYAHDQGIVHRDIKPENILLNRQGRVKVADFGLAKLVGTDAGAMPTPALSPGGGEGGTVLTEAGKVMGTPSYMAPEQSEHPSEVDHRADIYALGVVFYQMLTGELPGRPLQPPSSKVQIDVRLDEVVLRALEKKPELRYQQVSEVKTRVETIAATPPAISSGRESAPTHSAGGLGSQHSVGAAPPPASQDRFWRRFALALAAVVLAPILILVGVALLGMILGVLSGARPQNQQSTHSVARSTNALPATVQTLTAPAPSARTRPAELEFRLVAPEGSAAPADLLPDPNDSSGQRQLRVLRQVVADGSDVTTAGLAFERDGNRSILVKLTPSGSQRFAGVTARSVDRQLAIVFRGKLINAPVIRAPIRDGRLTITGRFSGPEVHEMVDSLNRVAQPTEETWRLSGPVEVVLPTASVTNFVLFDLDSQRWATNRMLQPDLRESRDWLRAAGVEVTALRQLLKQPVITGYDMVLAVAPSNAWDRVTAADLVQCLALADLSPRQEVNRAKDSEAVDTFFFLTREKGRGILQILGFSDDPAGVKIRYKLVQVAGTTSATSPQTNVSRTFSLRHILASEMADDLRQILLGRVGMEARPAPDNMQLTVTAPSDVLNRASTFVAVTDWPKRIAQGKDYYYPREDAEEAGRSFFYACSIEDIEGVTRMLAPGVLAELKGTNLTAHGVVGEEKDAELVRQLRGKWEGKEAAVRKVVQAWNRFPLRKLQVEGKFSRSPGPRYFASAAFEGAPVEWVELGFVPDRSLETRSRPHFGPEGPLLMDTLPPWFGEKEAGLKPSLPSPDATVGGDARAGDTAAAQVARLKLEAAQAALARAKASYDAGTASATEYRAVRLAKDIAEGELRGNTAAILGARLQFAEEEYVRAETKDKAGLATIGELDKAKLAKEVAEANLAGDPVAAARAELQFAEGELRRAKMLLEVGKVTLAEVEKARTARDIAAAELEREIGRRERVGPWQSRKLQKETWRDAGASTPEAALQTLLWAAREGDLDHLEAMMSLRGDGDRDYHGSYADDVPHVLQRVKYCSGVTIENVKYDGAGMAAVQMAIDGIPEGEAVISREIRMVLVDRAWKCDYPHDSLIAFKTQIRRKSGDPLNGLSTWKIRRLKKEKWQNVGTRTPEATLQTLLWAAREQDMYALRWVVSLPEDRHEEWYRSYTNDLPHVLERVKTCSEVTIEDAEYEGTGVAVVRMAIDGIPAGQEATSKEIRMILVDGHWKCDYAHDSVIAFKTRLVPAADSKGVSTEQTNNKVKP